MVADLSRLTTFDDYKALVAEELSDLNIGIVCLNAGAVSVGPFDLIGDEQVEQQVRLNMLHPVYLTKALLPKLVARNGRSAIIVTSSGLAGMPMPSVLCYSSTKACVSNFFTGLSYEVRDTVDVMVWEAGATNTNFVKDRPPSNSSTSAEVAV